MPRWLHKLRARLTGYFWLPCPVCGEMFGGHQILRHSTGALVGEDGQAFAVCGNPLCSYEAGARNALAGHPIVFRLARRRTTEAPPGAA